MIKELKKVRIKVTEDDAYGNCETREITFSEMVKELNLSLGYDTGTIDKYISDLVVNNQPIIIREDVERGQGACDFPQTKYEVEE